jgi:pSer/pThr/pTyr-binding forkhead associated (FHA) protein
MFMMDHAIASLLITQGTLERREHRFRESGRCVVGRGDACDIQLDLGFGAGRISRRHCLFVFEAPRLRICDLGSLNGTFVNGKCIGQRASEASADEDCPANEIGFHELHHGDIIRVGHTIIRVAIITAPTREEPYFFPSVLWM